MIFFSHKTPYFLDDGFHKSTFCNRAITLWTYCPCMFDMSTMLKLCWNCFRAFWAVSYGHFLKLLPNSIQVLYTLSAPKSHIPNEGSLLFPKNYEFPGKKSNGPYFIPTKWGRAIKQNIWFTRWIQRKDKTRRDKSEFV